MLEIQLSKGLVARVDEADARLIQGLSWHAVKARATFYAASKQGKKTIYMHRLIAGVHGAGFDVCIDHIDCDGLNNSRANLRTCTRAENARRRHAPKDAAGMRGVWKKGEKFVAQIGHQGKFIYLGIFKTSQEASAAYQGAAKRLFGEFAP